MALDARGAEISVGDTVIYFKTGRYAEKMTAVVKEVGPTIKIEAIDQLTRLYNRASRESARVKGTSLIVVEALPVVDGRLNTAAARAQLPGAEAGDAGMGRAEFAGVPHTLRP